MNILFILLFLFSFTALVVGLVKPLLFSRFRITTRKSAGLTFGGLLLLFLILSVATTPPTDRPAETKNSVQDTGVVQETKQPQQTVKTVSNSDTFLVTRVIDGDTIEIEGGIKVRYIGIDTPETVDPRKPVQCFGVEASNKNKELVSGKRVRLEKDISETDKYGRLLRYVYVGDTFVNLELVRNGYAYASSYPPDISHQSQFTEAQRLAKEQSKGLWGSCSSDTPTATQTPSTPTGSCNIKGNVSSGGKIYHLPGCSSYDKTVIDESAGEHWFCSEQEALDAGWRKALNCP